MNILSSSIRREAAAVAAGAAVIFGALWLHEHDARVRQKLLLEQGRRATAETVAKLEAEAKQDVEAANQQNAEAVSRLENERQAIEKRAQSLSLQLARLRQSEQAKERQIASLPLGDVEKQVTDLLGASSFAAGASSAAPGASQAARAKGQAAGNGGKGTKDGGERLELTDLGVRKVAATLDELGACRAESAIASRQAGTCSAAEKLDRQEIARQADSMGRLNQALGAKDKILQAREQQDQAELRAARGTFLGRLLHTTEHVALGIGIGVVAGMALR